MDGRSCEHGQLACVLVRVLWIGCIYDVQRPGDDLIVTMSILEYMSVELDSNGTHKYPFILIAPMMKARVRPLLDP